MSKQVDDRVVSMEFDNANFEKNVKTSMSTLERLKQALNFRGATKGLEAVDSAANKVNFSSMASAVDQIGVRFSAMQVVATTALANITNAAVNAGKQMVGALTLQPAISGYQEYETQIGSIQTILSNTRHAGTSLEEVTSALDELNTYADQTIYNFTEMTRNIGTFTAAGVDLGTSTQAIKGIANLGAVSGSTSVQVSTAMYQLSQALAAGRVSLMDWNSVVNAGMGGKLFQDALIRTSEVMHTGAQAAIEEYGSFRESLTQGQWLTAEVLTETLNQIAGAYTKEELIAKGYTEAQAQDILALADDATKAATKVRTFSQLISTTMEALGSGWTNTWEILVGDFEEATELWSSINEVISEAIGSSAEARNEMLQKWADAGGRQDVLDGLKAGFEGLVALATPIKEAFSDIFPPMTSKTLKDISIGFNDMMQDFKAFASEAAPVVKDVFTAIFSVVKAIGSVIGSAASGLGEFFGVISSSGGDIGAIVSKLAGFVTGAANAVTESGALTGILTVLGNAFGNVLNAITALLNGGVSKLGSMFSGVGDILSGAAQIIIDAVHNITSGIGDILGTADLGSIIDVFNSGMLAALVTSVRGWFDKLTGGVEDSTGGLIETITEMTEGISENVTDILDSVRGSLEAWQSSIKAGTLLKIAVAIAILAGSITVLAAIDPDRLTDSLGAITVLFTELLGSLAIFTKLNTSFEQLTGIATLLGLATGIAILALALKSIAELDMEQMEVGILGVAGLAAAMVVVSKAMAMGGNISGGAFQMILMAAAIKILASAAIDMSSLSWEEIGKGLASVGALLAEMAIFSNVVKSAGLGRVAVSLILISAALEILQDVVIDFGSMNIEQIVLGLATIGAALGELAIFTRLLPKGGTLLKSAAGIILISAALSVLEPVMASFASLGLEGAATGVAAIGGVLAALTYFLKPMLDLNIADMAGLMWAIPELIGSLSTIAETMNAMAGLKAQDIAGALVSMTVVFALLMKMIEQLDKMEIGDMFALSVAMPMVTDSLLSVAEAIRSLSGIGIEGSISSIVALGGAMKALMMGLDAVKGRLGSVAALLLVSGALIIFSSAIVLISNTGIIGVATSFIALAGAMTIIGLATKIMRPLIPTMYSFAGSIATMGASLVVLGAGTAATGAGLIFLVTGLAGAFLTLSAVEPAKAAQGLIILAGAFASIGIAAKLLRPLIPSILQLSTSIASLGLSCMAVSLGIAVLVAGLTALGSIGKEGAETIVQTLKELIVGISEMIPEIIDNLMNSFKTILLGLLDMLVEIAPQIAESLLQVISETLQSLSEYGPQMAGFFIDFLIGMLNAVAERIPELIPVINNFMHTLFDEIAKAASSWTDTGDAFGIGTSVLAGVAGLVVVINAIKSMIPGAMVGALQLTAFVIEIGAIIAALGALEQLTGASSFIQSGGDLLQSLGTALGQFVGGLIGGVAEGATSTLPQVGTNLSDFATNITPFLEAMSSVDQTAIDGVKNLALAIAALSGANFVDAVASFLTGEGTFDGLGPKLVSFGTAIKQFSDVVTGIDVDAINASANCGQALAALANAMPKEGGLAQAIFGESTDMGEFATQIVAFGMAMKMYAMAVSGVDFGPVQESAVAGHALSELAGSLPKDGGLAQAIFGESTDMGEFGTQILLFGWALKNYAAAVADLDIDSIKASAQAGQALSDLANALPDSGGLVSWLFGDNDIGSFGESMSSFGSSLKSYSDSLVDVDFDRITASTNAVTKLSEVLASGTSLDTSGIANINQIASLGTALNTFYTNISEIELGSVTTAITSLRNLVSFINSLAGLDTSGIGSFQAALSQLGQTSLDGLVNAFNNADLTSVGTNLAQQFVIGFNNGISNLSSQISSAISSAVSSLSSSEQAFLASGEAHSSQFAQGLQNGASTVASAAIDMVTSAANNLGGHYASFYNSGANLAVGFANGIRDNAFAASVAARAMANAAAQAAKNALQEHSPSRVMRQIGDYAGQGFVNGLDAYRDYSYSSGLSIAEAAVAGVSTLTGIYDSFGDLEATFKEITALSEKLNTAKKEDKKTTEEETENTSKLSDALKNTADSLQTLIDRKNDLKALDKILSDTGATLSDDFVAELLSSEGQYAGALTEMVDLTDEQMQRLSDIFDQTKLAEKMEDVTDTISQGIADMADRMSNMDAIQDLLSNEELNFSDAFIAELMNSSGEYADTAAAIVKLSSEQINEIASLYDRNQTIDQIQSAMNALSETMTDLSSKKRDVQAIDKVFKRLGVTLDKRFKDELMDTSGQFADSLAGISELSDDLLQQLNDTFMENELFDQVQEFISILSEDDGLAKAFENSGVSVEDFAKSIMDAGEDISDVASQIQDFAETVADGFSKLSINDQTGITEFVDNLRNNVVVAQDWGRNVEKVFSKVSGYPAEMVDAFKSAVLEGGIEKYGRIMQEMAGMSSGAIMQIISLWNQAKVVGSEVGTSIAGSMYNTMNDVGENVTKGMTNGIETGDSDVTNAAYDMCQTTVDAIKSYFKVNGDSGLSDVAYSIGKQVVEGLTTGLTQSATGLTEAMKLVDDAVAYLKSLADQGIDLQVRVTPVLDMTDFNNKLAALKSSAVSQVSSDIMDTVNSINNSMSQNGVKNKAAELTDAVKMLTDKVDSINPDNFGVTYQQNNYSPKALSTATIYRQTKNQISMAKTKSLNSFKK